MDAEGSSSSNNSDVNSCHASNKLVLAIILRVFQYIIKKDAKGISGKGEVENFETETSISDVDAANPSATRLLRKVFVGFILACCLLAYLLS